MTACMSYNYSANMEIPTAEEISLHSLVELQLNKSRSRL
jgi:hypothetical protein